MNSEEKLGFGGFLRETLPTPMHINLVIWSHVSRHMPLRVFTLRLRTGVTRQSSLQVPSRGRRETINREHFCRGTRGYVYMLERDARYNIIFLMNLFVVAGYTDKINPRTTSVYARQLDTICQSGANIAIVRIRVAIPACSTKWLAIKSLSLKI